MIRPLLLTSLLLAAWPGTAATAAACQDNAETRRNADGSRLRVTERRCPNEPCAQLTVSYARAKGQPFRVLAEGRRPNDDAPSPALSLIDWDHDGQFEAMITGHTLFGANTWVYLLGVSPMPVLQMHWVFKGVGYEPYKQGPYLVQPGHDSVAADARDFYRILVPGKQVAFKPEFRVLDPHPGENPAEVPPLCQFNLSNLNPFSDDSIEVRIPRKTRNRAAYCEQLGHRRHLIPRPLTANADDSDDDSPSYRDGPGPTRVMNLNISNVLDRDAEQRCPWPEPGPARGPQV
ncbi:hypothetical protein [Curvibacter gracilis]|uniref:hypothetical protein n=1 Tax=Curvibacter gracilis TaxID=230310 RepID=UPI0004815284|nr:hypothetical protein [Curvibacter gracilis]